MKIIRNLFGRHGQEYSGSDGLFLFRSSLATCGNLQSFLGPEAINRTGYLLQSNVELLGRCGWACSSSWAWILVGRQARDRDRAGPRPVGYATTIPLGSRSPRGPCD